MKELKVLSSWLKVNGYNKFAQVVEELSEYEEPWHEDVIKEVGEDPVSEDEYFEENFFQDRPGSDSNLDEIIMKREGFLQYAHGEAQSSYVNSGVYGRIYRGIYDGNAAVIKVMKNIGYYDDNEARNWKIILAAKDKMPPEMQKHIPIIYKVNSGSFKHEDPSEGSMDVEYEVVVMEELKRLGPHMIETLNNYRAGEKRMESMLKDEDYLFKIAKMVKPAFGRAPGFKAALSKAKDEDILKIMLSAGSIRWTTIPNLTKLISDYLVSTNEDAIHEAFNEMPNTFHYSNLNDFMTSTVRNAIRYSITPGSSPNNKRNLRPAGGAASSQFWENSPETGTFYRMLIELSENFNISWSDAHVGNIMIGADGNLKIIDVGLYEHSDGA